MTETYSLRQIAVHAFACEHWAEAAACCTHLAKQRFALADAGQADVPSPINRPSDAVGLTGSEPGDGPREVFPHRAASPSPPGGAAPSLSEAA